MSETTAGFQWHLITEIITEYDTFSAPDTKFDQQLYNGCSKNSQPFSLVDD